MFFWQISACLLLATLFAVFSLLIVHARKDTIYRPVALLAFFSSIPAIALAFMMVLGTPKPIGYWLFDDLEDEKQYAVIGFLPVVKDGVYVLLDMGTGKTPGYYKLPWSAETADKLQESEGKGTLSLSKQKKTSKIAGFFEFSYSTKVPKVTYKSPQEKQIPDKLKAPSNGLVLPPSE